LQAQFQEFYNDARPEFAVVGSVVHFKVWPRQQATARGTLNCSIVTHSRVSVGLLQSSTASARQRVCSISPSQCRRSSSCAFQWPLLRWQEAPRATNSRWLQVCAAIHRSNNALGDRVLTSRWSSWKSSICGLFERGKCVKDQCNYLHFFPSADDLKLRGTVCQSISWLECTRSAIHSLPSRSVDDACGSICRWALFCQCQQH
jgi:hypothetical protein